MIISRAMQKQRDETHQLTSVTQQSRTYRGKLT
jgi:hypothetical protein